MHRDRHRLIVAQRDDPVVAAELVLGRSRRGRAAGCRRARRCDSRRNHRPGTRRRSHRRREAAAAAAALEPPGGPPPPPPPPPWPPPPPRMPPVCWKHLRISVALFGRQLLTAAPLLHERRHLLASTPSGSSISRPPSFDDVLARSRRARVDLFVGQICLRSVSSSMPSMQRTAARRCRRAAPPSARPRRELAVRDLDLHVGVHAGLQHAAAVRRCLMSTENIVTFCSTIACGSTFSTSPSNG